MFCSKCGEQLQDGVHFCFKCGNEVNKSVESQSTKEVKVMLDPAEVRNYNVDGRRNTTSGHAGTYGWLLMIISIVFSLISMFAVGSDAFIPITIGGTALFVIGFLIRIFCP